MLISLFFNWLFRNTYKRRRTFFTVIALLKSKKSKIHQDLSLNYFGWVHRRWKSISKAKSQHNLEKFVILSLFYLKYVPHKADVPPIYLLMKHSHSSGSEYFSRCFYVMPALIWMQFEVNFYISKPFGFSNIRRRWNGAMSFGPWYLISTLCTNTM